MTVSRDPCGRWYVSFAVEVAGPGAAPRHGRGRRAWTWASRTSRSPPAGRRSPNPRKLARRERALARYQRRLARCQKGSANRAKAKAKVARAHRKVRASRTDFLHRASTRLVRDHDVIVVEDLAVTSMVRNRSLAKAICDCGWGTFRQHAGVQGRQGRAAPDRDRPLVPQSRKTCSACGHLLADAEPEDPARGSARPAAPGTTGTSTPRRTSLRQVLP